MIHLHRLPICPLLIRQPETQRLLPILQCLKTMTHSCLSKSFGGCSCERSRIIGCHAATMVLHGVPVRQYDKLPEITF